MAKWCAATALILAFCSAFAAEAGASTLVVVRERGMLDCGVSAEPVPGFAVRDADGSWRGFDIDYCRAIATAVLADAAAVRFVALGEAERFDALRDGRADVVAGAAGWTLGRDLGTGLDFVAVSFFDGQGFMVPAAVGVRSAFELDGTRVCVLQATTTARNLAAFFAANSMQLETVAFSSSEPMMDAYLRGTCDAVTGDLSWLAAERARFGGQADHVLLPNIVAKVPRGPVVREGDAAWADVVRWTHFALLAAEEVGVDAAAANAIDPNERPAPPELRGIDAAVGEIALLRPGWALEVIGQVGNYGEIFARHLGPRTPLNLERGMNALWLHGGLHYAMPFR